MIRKVAVFKPYNARHDNAFGSGQYEVFKSINKLQRYDVTFFLDDESVSFKGVKNRYIKELRSLTFLIRIYRKLFGLSFSKIPYYSGLDFNDYDVVITEGIHYSFLKYFDTYQGRLILNDSVTSEEKIKNIDCKTVNKLFRKATSVVVNDKIKRMYIENGIFINTTVIGHSVQLGKIKFIEREKSDGRLLSIGRLVEEKGYIFIFSAIMRLISKYPNLKLDVYGEGPLKSYLSSYINDNNLSNNIFLKGEIEYRELLNMFNQYDMFISHPIELAHVAEAFHMGNMEAMSAGIPVVTTNCGGVPFVVKDKAIICRQRSVDDLTESINSLLSDSERCNKMSVDGREYIDTNFSDRVIVAKWIKLLDEL